MAGAAAPEEKGVIKRLAVGGRTVREWLGRRRGRPQSILIHDLSEIPEFATAAEKAEFWKSHDLAPELFDKLPAAELDDWGQDRDG